MCKGNASCQCGKVGARIKANLSSGEIRTETLDGINYLVVPVLMAKADVVMNGGVIPVEEFRPESWDGVPVTVGHPESDAGEFLSANSPATIQDWCVGRIFNSTVDEGNLKGEAWIQIDKAERVSPGLISDIKGNDGMDVSTGYFCDVKPKKGKMNGREFEVIQFNIRPDHLALLPDEVGACSWEDGCGVRSNKGKQMSVKAALATIVAALTLNEKKKVAPKKRQAIRSNKQAVKAKNEDKPEDPVDEVNASSVDDLLACPGVPFSEADRPALEMLSEETIAALCAEYSGEAMEVDPKDTEGEMNEDVAEEDEAANEDVPAKKEDAKMNSLSKKDREALAFAHKIVEANRKTIVDKIVGNSTIKADQLKSMTVDQLEVIANGLAPKANYSGARSGPIETNGDDNSDDMVPISIVDHIRNRNKKA